MSSSKQTSTTKKRRLDNLFSQDDAGSKKTAESSASMTSVLLKDVCLCLTGLASNKKTELHALAEAMGGRYVKLRY